MELYVLSTTQGHLMIVISQYKFEILLISKTLYTSTTREIPPQAGRINILLCSDGRVVIYTFKVASDYWQKLSALSQKTGTNTSTGLVLIIIVLVNKTKTFG